MPADGVYVLCKSARETHDAGTTEIVIVTNRPSHYWQSLRGLGVSLVFTPCDWAPATRKFEKLWKRFVVHSARLLGGTRVDKRLLGGSVARFLPTLYEAWCHPMMARWNAYVRVLTERPHVERVFLTDVKDVLFQSSCFDRVDGDRFLLFEEGPMDETGWTARWIRDGFGSAAVRAMAAKGAQEVNGGTMLGTGRAALDFLGRVQNMFARYPFRTVDQAVINWLLFREGEPDYVVRVPNITGTVATLSSPHARDSVELRDGVIVRKADRGVCPVVHMWDRWPDLKSSVLARYGLPASGD